MIVIIHITTEEKLIEAIRSRNVLYDTSPRIRLYEIKVKKWFVGQHV